MSTSTSTKTERPTYREIFDRAWQVNQKKLQLQILLAEMDKELTELLRQLDSAVDPFTATLTVSRSSSSLRFQFDRNIFEDGETTIYPDFKSSSDPILEIVGKEFARSLKFKSIKITADSLTYFLKLESYESFSVAIQMDMSEIFKVLSRALVSAGLPEPQLIANIDRS